MVGSAVRRRLTLEGCNILTAPRQELDLRSQRDVSAWVTAKRPELVFVAAATVDGIHANSPDPAEFLFDNLMIEANIFGASYYYSV